MFNFIFNRILMMLNYIVNYTSTTNQVSINNKHFIDFKYKLYNNEYIHRICINNGPIILRNIQIYNDLNFEVTDKLKQYIGPNYDFNGSKLCPSDFGESILVVYEDGELVKTIKENEIITI